MSKTRDTNFLLCVNNEVAQIQSDQHKIQSTQCCW